MPAPLFYYFSSAGRKGERIRKEIRLGEHEIMENYGWFTAQTAAYAVSHGLKLGNTLDISCFFPFDCDSKEYCQGQMPSKLSSLPISIMA